MVLFEEEWNGARKQLEFGALKASSQPGPCSWPGICSAEVLVLGTTPDPFISVLPELATACSHGLQPQNGDYRRGGRVTWGLGPLLELKPRSLDSQPVSPRRRPGLGGETGLK